MVPKIIYSELESIQQYSETCNISRNLVGNKLADHSDVVGASPVGVFILDLTSMD